MSNVTSTGDPIDPNMFNKDELLKLVYRDIQTLITKSDIREKNYMEDKSRQEDRIMATELDIRELKTIIAEQNKAFKSSLKIVSIALAFLSLFCGLLGWLFN